MKFAKEFQNISLKNNKSSYALMPVWVMNTTWRDEKFIFAMNGQTGKFVGNLPADKGLMWKYFLGVFAAVGAVAGAVGGLIASFM